MSQIPRPIVNTLQPCAQCGTALKVTFDALNRPRHRCPRCHGVVTTPIDAGVAGRLAQPTPELARLRPSPAELTRMAQTVRPVLAPGLRADTLPAGRVRLCVDCGAVLPPQHGRGRPRVRCADTQACRERAA